MVDHFAVRVLEVLPENVISRVVGRLAETRLPGPLQALVNETFARAAGVDREEARRPPAAYPTLDACFTRRLRPTARQVDADPEAAVVPVDGELSTFGGIDGGALLQAKGRHYSVGDLLDSPEDARPFQSGSYATFYLSPSEYHRIHSPVTGAVDRISYIPGHLFPVFPVAVEHVDELFAVNERLVSFIDAGARGPVAVVKVGATCVGRIAVTFHPLETNRCYRRRRVEAMQPPVEIENGDELGAFHLGSTVIVLIGDESFEFDGDLTSGQSVGMGTQFGGWAL